MNLTSLVAAVCGERPDDLIECFRVFKERTVTTVGEPFQPIMSEKLEL
jgi:hypothetical protein